MSFRAIIDAFFKPSPYFASLPLKGSYIPTLKLLLSEIPISETSVLKLSAPPSSVILGELQEIKAKQRKTK